jgi:hypothetical protein
VILAGSGLLIREPEPASSLFLFSMEEALKIILWQDGSENWAFRPPPLVVKEEGTVLQFHDQPKMYDLEIGDSIHYKTGLGTVEFRVSEIVPAGLPDYPPELNLVTARKKES